MHLNICPNISLWKCLCFTLSKLFEFVLLIATEQSRCLVFPFMSFILPVIDLRRLLIPVLQIAARYKAVQSRSVKNCWYYSFSSENHFQEIHHGVWNVKGVGSKSWLILQLVSMMTEIKRQASIECYVCWDLSLMGLELLK